ncbi:MAG: prepilin-type N-terminal cleavage/methylation domain-containing protein, partial [Bdellovibrionales bacterium]|nr:prepilin-type N-terminal cleavage/methylation domain-containing protein [Bdellovibrionales bacterium]
MNRQGFTLLEVLIS